jgi:hypothetical protein
LPFRNVKGTGSSLERQGLALGRYTFHAKWAVLPYG